VLAQSAESRSFSAGLSGDRWLACLSLLFKESTFKEKHSALKGMRQEMDTLKQQLVAKYGREDEWRNNPVRKKNDFYDAVQKSCHCLSLHA